MEHSYVLENDRPRVMRVDLGALERRGAGASIEAWSDPDPALDRLGSFSGEALALVLLRRALERGDEAPFIVAAGDCVRRALPTAARATVVSRAPLTGLLADGQVGTDLGRRLVRVCDALVIEGAASAPTFVLHVAGDGRVELIDLPELAPLGPQAIAHLLRARFGPSATLCNGRAGRARVAFASLAAGADPPSYVGRGGLGAAFGARGLAALVVSADPVEPDGSASHDDRELVRLLARSPRLKARGEGGTLELVQAFGARGDLRTRNYAESMSREAARDLADEIAHAPHARKGCEGCPTPCGWVFERGHPSARAPQGGHFSALYALGPNLGLNQLDDSLALLARCDELALDAKETGAVLALLCRAHASGFGDRARIERWLDEIVDGRGEFAIAARGAHALARHLGLEHESFTVKRMAARPESNLAAILGQCASARGADPMRAFPFLLQDGASRARLEQLLAPLPLPERAEDPRDPAAKGRIVWWHENLTAAVDALGFCAFSAAGLLGDGVCDLDELAARIGPASVRASSEPGRELLALGASIATIARDLNVRMGAIANDDRPEWARAALDAPSMWAEYARLRGVDASGAPTKEAWSRLSTRALLDVGMPLDDASAPAEPARTSSGDRKRRTGRVEVHAIGALSRALEPHAPFELPLPARLDETLIALSAQRPAAAQLLIHRADLVPAVYRGGARLAPHDLVADGDQLDLVIAIGGG